WGGEEKDHRVGPTSICFPRAQLPAGPFRRAAEGKKGEVLRNARRAGSATSAHVPQRDREKPGGSVVRAGHWEAAMPDYLGADQRKTKEEEKEDKPIRALDEGDIALLKTYKQ
ncbi:putative 26S protease regulatory subunit 7 protein, partial [Naja naja]